MRIGVWNTAFLGDAVLTIPLIRVIRAAYPEAEMDFYVRSGLESLFGSQPELDRVYTCEKGRAGRGISSILAQGGEIRDRRYDIWVDAHLSLRSSCMAWASHAPLRAGYSEAALSRLVFTHKTSRRFHEFQEIERLLLLAEVLGVSQEILQNSTLHWPELVLPAQAGEEAARLLAPLAGMRVIGLHPGSVWPTKRWMPEGFAHVLSRALKSGMGVVLLAGPGEEHTARLVRDLAGIAEGRDAFLDISGKTSLLSLAAVLGHLNGYVTNDSGPMHLAWAQRVPVTAIFGPTVPALCFAPRGEGSSVMETAEPCRPCGLHGHRECPKGHFRCMKNIDPEAVWQDVLRKLETGKQA